MTDEEMAHYSAALDEIWRLRHVLAYEAAVIETHLGYKTFPKSRRPIAEQQVQRLRQFAGEECLPPFNSNPSYFSLAEAVFRSTAGCGTFTRYDWEHRSVDSPLT